MLVISPSYALTLTDHVMQVSQRVICDKLAVLLPKIGNRTWLPRRSGTSLAQVLQCAHPWGSVQWADKIVRVCCSAQMMLSMMCDEDDLAEPLQNHFSDIFQNNLPPRLQRFSTLQESIVDELVPALAAAVMAAVRPKLERMVEATLADLYTFKSPLSADTIGRVEYLDRIVAGVIISHFIQVMQDEAASPNLMRLPETFKLEEAKEVQEQRAQLHDKISRLKTADSQISHIEDAFNTPDSPAAALVAAVNGGFGPETQQHSASDVQSVVPQSGHQSLPVSTSPVSVAAPTLTALPPATAPAAATATPNTAIGPSTTAAIAATATSPAASVGPAVVATAAASPPAVNASAAATTPTALPATPARVLTTGTPTAAAAEMEAELEDVPISPASVADSFVHVK